MPCGIPGSPLRSVGGNEERHALHLRGTTPVTWAKTERMADLAREALDEGAIGISTGLGYAPGVFANGEELVGVTAPLAERGGVYASHARAYFDPPRAPDDRTIESPKKMPLVDLQPNARPATHGQPPGRP